MSQQKIILPTLMLTGLLAVAPAALAGPDGATENAAVNALLEAWNTGVDNIDSFLSEGATFKDPFFSFSGRQHYRDLVAFGRRTYSDMNFKADELIMDGDRGALAWTVSATDNASGNAVDMRGVSILRFEDDKIAAEWRIYDAAELARQLGGTVTFPGQGDSGGDTSD